MKLYEVKKSGTMEADGTVQSPAKREFVAKKGDARRLGRAWNDNRRLTESCGITFNEHVVKGGRDGFVTFLNEVVLGNVAPKTAKAVKSKKPVKAKKR